MAAAALQRSMFRKCLVKNVVFGLNFPGCRQFSTSSSNSVHHPNGHLWSTEFWDNFYKKKWNSKENSFDWFLSYESLKQPLSHILKETCESGCVPIRVLDIGSGTSDFAVQLYKSSTPPVHQITCVDFSDVATQQMSSLHRLLEPDDVTSTGVTYITGDVKNLPFKDGTFDMILDKGTTDAVVRAPQGEEAFDGIFRECSRLLKDGRMWLQVSDTPPEDRLDLIRRSKLKISHKDYSFQISYKDLGVHFGVEYFMYFIQKNFKIV